MRVSFTDNGWDDYLHWAASDRKVLIKINALIEDIKRDPFSGIGKPEPLKHALAGAWSRRIDREHRLVYLPGKDNVDILSARRHYGD